MKKELIITGLLFSSQFSNAKASELAVGDLPSVGIDTSKIIEAFQEINGVTL